MQPSPSGEYERRRVQLVAQIERLSTQERWLAVARGITFLTIPVAIWAAARADLWWGVPVAVAAAFVALVLVDHAVAQRRTQHARLADYYARGLARLGFDWTAGNPGHRHRDDDHPYASDLDLFGDGSLFQFLSQARTQAGEDCLAGWLKAPAARDVIEARQAAVRDLRDRLELREQLALLAGEVESVDVERLQAWCREPLPARSRAPHAIAGAATLLTLMGMIATAASTRGLPVLVIGIAGLLGMLAWGHARISPALAGIRGRARDLEVIAGTLRVLERAAFTAPQLVTLQQRLRVAGAAPSATVARLERLLGTLEWQYNQLFLPFALLLVWPVQLGLAVYRWRRAHGAAVLGWITALGEIEALVSLATFAYEQPDTTFPEIAEAGPVFDAEALGHPLLAPAGRVCNDLAFGREPQIFVVSGSNMSGKSTLLRTVGINAVLALAGAPVAAARLRLSPVQLAATLHIQDSLLAGRSRFWAEILKLRKILELTRAPLPVLFLIDEIFHGTNSHDRQVGGAALIRRGLLERGVIGLVTTHDQALSTLGDTLAPRIQNVHFTDFIKDGAIEFDYRLRPGAVQHSNALELMRSIGVDV